MEDEVVDLNNFMIVINSNDISYHIENNTVDCTAAVLNTDTKASVIGEEVDEAEGLLKKRLGEMIDKLELADMNAVDRKKRTITVLDETWNNFRQLRQVYTLEVRG